MSRSTPWQRHADRHATERERLYPGSVPIGNGATMCPLHGDWLGSVSRMCLRCFREAWEWTAEQAHADRGAS